MSLFSSSDSRTTNVTETTTEDNRAQADGGSVVSTGGDVIINNTDSEQILDGALDSFNDLDTARINLLSDGLNKTLDIAADAIGAANNNASESAQQTVSTMTSITDRALAAQTGDATPTVKYALIAVFFLMAAFIWRS